MGLGLVQGWAIVIARYHELGTMMKGRRKGGVGIGPYRFFLPIVTFRIVRPDAGRRLVSSHIPATFFNINSPRILAPFLSTKGGFFFPREVCTL